jgi:hypothetical protein
MQLDSRTLYCACGLATASLPPMFHVCPIHGKWAGEHERYYDPGKLLDANGKLKPRGEAMRAEDV